MDEKFAQQTLLGRLGQPREMTTIMKFMCSEEASYITGSIILADGGLLVNSLLDFVETK